MTAAEFAELVNARPTGRGTWIARCPAHEDRSPSLSISEGRDGRVLLHCWAGCQAQTVLDRLKLRLRDLFNDAPPPTPEQVRQAAQERLRRDAARRSLATIRRASEDHVRRFQAVVSALGNRLARATDDPAGDELTRLFHETCEKLHRAEQQAMDRRRRELEAA